MFYYPASSGRGSDFRVSSRFVAISSESINVSYQKTLMILPFSLQPVPLLKDSINVGVQLNGGSTTYFTITVEDVNDNPPMFDGNQGSQISLDVPEVGVRMFAYFVFSDIVIIKGESLKPSQH